MIDAADNWIDYELLDASRKERLERWGKYVLRRPDPQILWDTPRTAGEWQTADAVYHRSERGGGYWQQRGKMPQQWQINYDRDTRFIVSPTGFKHTGVFPEQAVNWEKYKKLIRAAGRPVKVLNLFAYTGGATVACLQAGASVCHVDASRGMVEWAKRNIELNGLSGQQVRYIVDDCAKFVAREIRRGVRYDALILDPPSYGRGPSGEVWKLEDNIYELLKLCAGVLCERPLFAALNSYTAGLAPSVTGYMMASIFAGSDVQVQSGEIGIKVTSCGLALPCGSTAWIIGK